MAEYMETEYIQKPILKIAIKSHFKKLKYRGKYAISVMDANADINRIISEIPAADVVEVVRCKDCKHSRNMPLGLCYLHTEPSTNATGYKGEAVCVNPDDFCSYGERKVDK